MRQRIGRLCFGFVEYCGGAIKVSAEMRCECQGGREGGRRTAQCGCGSEGTFVGMDGGRRQLPDRSGGYFGKGCGNGWKSVEYFDLPGLLANTTKTNEQRRKSKRPEGRKALQGPPAGQWRGTGGAREGAGAWRCAGPPAGL